MSWEAAPGPVIRYRLSYVPLSGAGEILEAQTLETETSIVLQELFPFTTYRVSVFAEYTTGLGQEMQIDGTTKEGEPENLFQNNLQRQVDLNCQCDSLFFNFSPWFSS